MRSRTAAAFTAAVLLFAGCGADDEDHVGSDDASTSTAVQSTSTTESTTPESTTTTESTITASTTVESTTDSGGISDTTGLPKERCRGAERPPNIVDVIAYGADCAAVEATMAELQSVSREFRIGDFDCARVSGIAISGIWECRGEASYFTFTFGD